MKPPQYGVSADSPYGSPHIQTGGTHGGSKGSGGPHRRGRVPKGHRGMSSVKKHRKAKINRHKRKKRRRLSRHKKRTWG